MSKLENIIANGNRGGHVENSESTIHCADGFSVSVIAGGGTYCAADYTWPAPTADTLRAALLATRKADDAERFARLLTTRPELAPISLAAQVRDAIGGNA